MDLPDGMGWLMRPVLAGKLDVRALYDGSVDLAMVALLNDALDVEAENRYRVHEAMKAAE